MSETTSSNSNSSQSTSSSNPVQTPENDIVNAVSGVASGMASQLFNWAQGVFAQTSQITNEAVNNFFQTSQQMMGLSNSMIDQYNSLFAPENAQLVADANSYASPARLATDMGAAGATAAQAGQSAEANSLAQLQQFGIDPSSGRYAGLINADNVANAGNVAGQENLQERADVATGQQLRAEAVQTGAQLPSSIANVENTGIQANTGAENAELANANTGVNLMGLPDQFLNTATHVLPPFNAQRSQSSSLGGGSSQTQKQPTQNQGGGSGQPGNGGGGNGAPSTFSGMTPNPGATIFQGAAPTSGGGGSQNFDNPLSDEQMTNPFSGPQDDASQTFNDAGGGNAAFSNPQTDASNAFGTPSQGMDTNQGVFGNNTSSLDLGGLNGSDQNVFGNPTAPAPSPSPLPGGIDTSVTSNFQLPPDDGSNPAAGSGGDSQPAADQGSEDPGAGDMSQSFGDDSGGDGGGDGFARGGAVPMRKPPTYRMPNMMASGGQVPSQMSPSGGRKVDDVRAQGPGRAPMRLNANEFVIPQDVALWKGQEFFQNLINDSRKKRMSPASAPAKPTAQPMGGQ